MIMGFSFNILIQFFYFGIPNKKSKLVQIVFELFIILNKHHTIKYLNSMKILARLVLSELSSLYRNSQIH